MRIDIRSNGMEKVVIIRFSTTDNFESDYERSKFFRELHGWKQTVPRNGKRYVYHRNGVLDEVPHAKIADSVFIIAMEHMRRVEEFFREWEEKVECDMRRVMMARKDLEEMMEEMI